MEFRKTLSEILEQQIKTKYRTIKQFSVHAEMPYMTVLSVIKRGVENTTVGTLQKICEALDITITDLYHMQALDTIQNNLNNINYSDDDLLSDLYSSRLIRKKFLTPEEKKTIINNYRFFFSTDWI